MRCLLIAPGERPLKGPTPVSRALDWQAASLAERAKAIRPLNDGGEQGAVNTEEAAQAHAATHTVRRLSY